MDRLISGKIVFVAKEERMKKAGILFAAFMFCFSAFTLFSQSTQTPSSEIDPRVPKGSKIYISPLENGYHIYLAAAIQKKEVPVILVMDKSRADFELSAVTESEKAGWAKMLFMSSGASAEQASFQLVNLKTATISFGYNVNKSSSAKGKQSSAEACAKHLKEKIESGK
jgi:hypothetical protein